jgi:succinoglycan biosynthesis transport protein ExoP
MQNILPPRTQRSALPPSSTEADYVYAAPAEESHLRDYWGVVVKRRNLVILVFLVILGVGTYFALSATRLYTASATIKIEPQNPTVTGVTEMFPSQAGLGGPYDYHQTQFVLLGSRALAAMVINDLKLASNPVFTNARVISASPVDRIISPVMGFLQTLINFVSSKSEEQPSRNQKQISDINEGGFHEYQQNQTNPGLNVSPWLVGRYRSFLKVNPIKNTRLVELQFTTPNPELSQQLANAHASGFIRMNLEARFDLTNEAREFLDNKNVELKKKLEKSEAALNQFRQTHGVVSLEKGENVVVDRLVELNRALTTAKAQRIEAESLHRTVQNKDSQSLSQVIKEGLVPTLRGNLASLEAERTKLSTTYKPEHPRMVELNQQISETRRSINNEIANVVRGIQANYAAALNRENALQSEADRQQQKALDLKQVGVQYAVLEEEVKVNRGLYESVLKRLNETSVANDLAVSNMRVVERAAKPSFPSYPNTVMSLLISAALGILLGVGFAFGLEYLDSSINTPQLVWSAVGLSTFGVVPALNSLNRSLVGWNGSARPWLKGLTRPRLQAPNTSGSSELALIENPLSVIAESYRTIRTAFLFSQAEKPPQIVLLTSPSPGEGKTMTMLNLAIALAQDGHRVLIIDADLRKGCCHARLKMKNHKGLSNVLTGNLTLEQSIQATRIDGLFLISAGIRSPNPSDLLGSNKMREILSNLRESFKFVLIDSPPAIAVSDAAILSVVSDGVILVFHGQKTTMASARQVVERLDAIRAPILGVVLNGVDLANPEYAYYRHYYGSDYGLGDEPKNGAGRIVEVAGHEELPKDESQLEELRPGTVTSKLTDVVGHMAETMRDQIASLRESRKTSLQSRSKELFEKADESLRKHIDQSMQEQEKTFSYRDPSVGKISAGGLRSRHVPREFFDRMTSQLCEAAGPMAPLIIRDQIDRLGESLESFPKTRLKELVERICPEILNQKLRRNFQQTMSSEIRSL